MLMMRASWQSESLKSLGSLGTSGSAGGRVLTLPRRQVAAAHDARLLALRIHQITGVIGHIGSARGSILTWPHRPVADAHDVSLEMHSIIQTAVVGRPLSCPQRTVEFFRREPDKLQHTHLQCLNL